jgi:hypothetical protein
MRVNEVSIFVGNERDFSKFSFISMWNRAYKCSNTCQNEAFPTAALTRRSAFRIHGRLTGFKIWNMRTNMTSALCVHFMHFVRSDKIDLQDGITLLTKRMKATKVRDYRFLFCPTSALLVAAHAWKSSLVVVGREGGQSRHAIVRASDFPCQWRHKFRRKPSPYLADVAWRLHRHLNGMYQRWFKRYRWTLF